MPLLQQADRQDTGAKAASRGVFAIAQARCIIAHLLINKCVIFVASIGFIAAVDYL